MFEDISRITKELNALRESRTLILVEGKRDQEALQRLGFSQITTISTHLDGVSQEIALLSKTCAILTDLDPAGRRLHARISRDVQVLGVAVDDRLRRALLTSPRVKHIEALDKCIVKANLHNG